jgi:hypothetical protein
MIIGINFTGITEDVAALEDYRKALRLNRNISKPWSHLRHRLQGLTDSKAQVQQMLHQADNGRRSIIVVPAKRGFFALYIR